MTTRAPRSPSPAPTPAPALAAEAQARAVADRSLSGPVSWTPLSPGLSSEPVPSVPGAGEALAPDLRSDMEHRLGGDLSSVRIHRDLAAERAAEQQDANAFAIGRDVYFGRGAYSPGTSDGRRLLAHELAHATQQLRTGLLSIQRDEKKEKKKKKPAAPPPIPDEIANLTDAEKIQKRAELRAEANTRVDKIVGVIDTLPAIAQLPPAEKAALSQLEAKLKAARKGAEQVADPADKAARLSVLSASEALLTDKLFVHFYLNTPGLVSESTLAAIADPAHKMTPEDIAVLNQDAGLLRGGGRAVITDTMLSGVYREAGINPEWLKTEDLSEDEAAEKGAPKDALTAEDKQRLQEIFDAVPEGGENRDVIDPKVLAEKLRDMSPEDIEQLKAFLRLSPPKTDEEPAPVEEQLEQFKQLSPAERDTLLVNQELKNESPSKTKLDGKVLLDLSKASDPLKKSASEIDSNMELVASLITDPDKMKKYSPISIDIGLFAREMALFRGLLAGGSARSELVRGAVTDLTAEIARAQQEIQEAMLEELAITAALAALPVVGEAKLLATLARLELLRRKIEKIRKAFAVYDQVKRFVDLVAAAPDAIADFRAFVDQAGMAYTTYLPLLEQLEDEPALDEKIAQFEDDLAEKFDALLDTKFGDVLEMLYLPPDASPEELMHLIFDLPKGIAALEDTWTFYQSANPDAPDTVERILIRSAKAGALLHPLVGFLAAYGAEQVGAAFPDRNIADRLIGKLSGYKKNAKDRRDANRGSFFRLNRRNYDYNEADLKPFLEKGATRLAKLIEDDEPGQHWTAGWLRVTLRDEVKTLNREFSKETVTAKVKEKKAKGSKKKGAAPARTETVPLPPFRLKFLRNDKDPKNETVELHLNPTKPLKFDTLSYDDFKKSEGVPFKLSGKAKRDKALRSWLDDREFAIVSDNDGNPHVRLRGGNTATGTGRTFLHIDASGTPSKLREGIQKDDYKKFLGRQVEDSEDLPEGFYLKQTTAGATVSRKSGVRSAQEAPMLGLDSSGKLSDSEKKTLGPETKAAPGVTEPADADLENYDWQQALATTISGGEYNRQDAYAEGWKNRADRNPDIKKRPKRVSGDLGYVLRARAFGDKLSSAHLPELKDSDDKGHLVAKRFGGTDHVRNLVPMKRTVNQFPGKWFTTESDMAKVYTAKDAKPGHRAHLSIEIDYPHAMTRRPSRFRVEWKEQDAAGKPVAGKGSGKKISISN